MSVQPHTFHKQRHQAIALVLQSWDATLLTQANGIKAIQTVGNGHESLASTSPVTQAREHRADQYGIRTTVGWNPC